MGPIFIVARKDVGEALLSKTTYFYMAFLFFIILPYFDGFRNVLGGLVKQGLGAAELQLALQPFLNNLIHTLPLVLVMLFCSFLAAYAIIMDKAKRTLESLLATPLSLKQIWLGKSLAVALPGIAIMLIILTVIVVALNFAFIVPLVGYFIMPDPLSIVTTVIIIPVMVFFVVLMVSLFQLTMANPRIANFAYIALFLGIYFATVTGLTATWDLSVIYLVLTVVLAAATFVLSRFLTKEKIVLSSKG
ncbi:MAG: hypothetical protein ABIH70_02095 [Chloroflexota bacterium]